MLWRRPLLRWAVIFVALGLVSWRLWSPAPASGLDRHPASGTDPVLASGSVSERVASPDNRVIPADFVAVISIEEYSGKLLAAALSPGEAAPEPYVIDDTIYLSGAGPAPAAADQLLALRFLRTQLRTYRTWALTAPAPPLALALDGELSDVRDVWHGTEALGPMDIVQPENRLLRGDVTITALAADGTLTIQYGDAAYVLAPGDTLRFAAARSPDADADAIDWLDDATDEAFGEWLTDHVLQGSADTVLHITNHGLFARADIHAGSPAGWAR